MSADALTVLEMIHADYRAAGGVGDPPTEWMHQWRLANPDYGDWPLDTRFRPGSRLPIRPFDALDRANAEWVRRYPGINPVLHPEFGALYVRFLADAEKLERATETPAGKARREESARRTDEARVWAANHAKEAARLAETRGRGVKCEDRSIGYGDGL